MFNKQNKLGSINISNDAVVALATDSVLSCYGVVALSNKGMAKPIQLRVKRGSASISIYIVVAYGVRITEVVNEVQKRVKYDLEKKFNLKFKAINVYVDAVKDIFADEEK